MNDTVNSAPELLLESSGSDIDLHGLLIAILYSKWLILGMAFTFGLVCFIYVKRQPLVYQAQVEMLPPQAARGSGVAALAGSGSTDVGLNALGAAVQAKNQIDSFTVILQAWPLAESMVKRFDLAKAYGVPNDKTARSVLSSRTTIVGTREGFIKLSVLDTDRQRSAILANGYVDAAREFLQGLSLSEASQRRVFYEGQLASSKNALIKAEESFRHMQQATGMIAVDSQTQNLVSQAAGFRSQITAKELQIEGLRTYSTAENPQVQIAEAELAAMREKLAQLESRGDGGYMGKSLSSMPSAELDFVRATRELKYQESLYDLMVRQYEGSKLDEARDAPAIQVIEPALPPDGKFGPHPAKSGLTGFGIGLVTGLVIALFRYWRAQMGPDSNDRWLEFRRALHWKPKA